MPKIIEIAEGGATETELDEAVDHFISLRVSRDRQPALVFDDERSEPQRYLRTSNGEFLFGAVQVKDRETLRTLLAGILTRRGRVVIGLVEGSAAREDNSAGGSRSGGRSGGRDSLRNRRR